MLPIIDPSLRASVGGSVSAVRGANGGTKERPTAQIMLERGVLSLHDYDNESTTKANWAPRGEMIYDFREGVVTEAELTGEFSMERRSTNHFIFESRFSVQPKYSVTYHCEVLR